MASSPLAHWNPSGLQIQSMCREGWSPGSMPMGPQRLQLWKQGQQALQAQHSLYRFDGHRVLCSSYPLMLSLPDQELQVVNYIQFEHQAACW